VRSSDRLNNRSQSAEDSTPPLIQRPQREYSPPFGNANYPFPR
jgi:hypothetical protein